MDALSWPGSNCVGVVVGMIHGPCAVSNSRYESPKVSPVKMLVGAVIDDGLVMQRVAGRVHAFEDAAGELEALAVLRDDDALARDRQDLAVQLRVQLVAVHGARAGDQLGRIDHVRRAARMHAPRWRAAAPRISAPAPPA